MQQVEEPNYIDTIGRIQTIDSEKAFSGLTDKEKNYSYHFARASWEGAKICYFERSYESPALLYMFTRIFASQTVEEVHELLKKNNFSDLEWT
jgi:dipeptidyl-peptidase-3